MVVQTLCLPNFKYFITVLYSLGVAGVDLCLPALPNIQ